MDMQGRTTREYRNGKLVFQTENPVIYKGNHIQVYDPKTDSFERVKIPDVPNDPRIDAVISAIDNRRIRYTDLVEK